MSPAPSADADGHLLLDGALDDLGSRDGGQAELVGEVLVDGKDRTLLVALDVPVGVVVRVQVAQDRVGVGHGGPQPTTVVAGRPAVRPADSGLICTALKCRLYAAIVPPPAPSVFGRSGRPLVVGSTTSVRVWIAALAPGPRPTFRRRRPARSC